jgi:Carboxypeptidase regulatory-like domain
VKVFLVLVFVGIIPRAALGQSQMQAPVTGPAGTPITRSIEGTVLDAHDSAVPHAVVLLKDTKTLQVRSYLAQNDGRYHFYGLSSDINYELRAQANGLTSPVKTVSVFDSHRVITLNLKLKKKLKQ